MKRALLIVLDSVGIGHAPDASDFGDEGANTLGHIRETVAGFSISTLDEAGLSAAERLASGQLVQDSTTTLSFGCLTEQSAGKDTTTGHWEIAGAPVTDAFTTYDQFPKELVDEMEAATGVTFLGNYAQSGTVILNELGEEHCRTGKPILYTSADSVIQIAAHEEVVPLDALYAICKSCRKIADRERIGRVIARPFLGEPGNFSRTRNRHDFSMTPPTTVLNLLSNSGTKTIGVGKISDIFDESGIDVSHPTANNEEGCNTIDRLLADPGEQSQLIFANLVDFDMLYGHRRDPVGYAGALEAFDQWLKTLLPRLDDDLLLIITADHGNDPTWPGTDHTRERVPLLVHEPGVIRNLGIRNSLADISATLADWFGLSDYDLAGHSFLSRE